MGRSPWIVPLEEGTMSRNSTRATLVVAALASAWCGARPAEASNAGFKLERSFDLLREPGTGRPYLNLYSVSYPLYNGLGDVADPNHPGGNKCVGDIGGPTRGDGFIDATDAICDHWTSREGSFVLEKFDRDTCSYRARTATLSPIGGIQFTGTFTYRTPGGDPGNLLTNATGREIGYFVLVSSSSPTVSPRNPAVLVGSHDPSFTGRAILAAPLAACARTTPRFDIQNLPYHSMYARADEILCGLEGVDWVDAVPPLGDPDTCPNGTLPAHRGVPFDGAHVLSVQTNEASRGWVSRTVAINPITRTVAFTGTNFALHLGEAYMLLINADHAPTTFLAPHF
jgi:hypothetical protein